ncbi:electron transfer flavoprotein subunit beta/FixA family protein [Paenibacillus sp. BR2-3]|uniref:electron transfer flavoprotein subunit beta/FixA family protein n=1 Tax=Paenibacillus sp. BR2-3 TaxID=3048494 RepID=UPI003977C8D9
MRIGVCVKQVQTYPSEPMINPADVFAVEEALRIRERLGGSVTVMSMGAESVEKSLRKCVALGADKGVLLTDRLFAGSDTLATANVLSRGFIEIGKPDLIICGTHSIDGETAQVGPSLAEKLAIPHTTHVVEIICVEEQHILCKRMTDEGYEWVDLTLPALITVAKGINQPRMATVKGILGANRSEITRLSAKDLHLEPQACGLAGSPTRVKGTHAVTERKIEFTVTGDSLHEQVDYIVHQLLNAMKV